MSAKNSFSIWSMLCIWATVELSFWSSCHFMASTSVLVEASSSRSASTAALAVSTSSSVCFRSSKMSWSCWATRRRYSLVVRKSPKLSAPSTRESMDVFSAMYMARIRRLKRS